MGGMPRRCLRCTACGIGFDRYRSLGVLRGGLACPQCGSRRTRLDLAAELRTVSIPVHQVKPFFSDTMGCLHARERLAGEVYDAQNRILVTGKAHRERLMKRLNKADRRDWHDRTPVSHRDRRRYQGR